MSTRPLLASRDPDGRKAIHGAAIIWFLVAATGQWAFVLYMLFNYGRASLAGLPENWTETAVVGHVAGDTIGNWMFGLHILFGAVLTAGGTLQLVNRIRMRWPRLHRWNGRAFIVTSLIISLGGLYLIWVRDAVSTMSTGISVSVNGVLIIVFALIAWRKAGACRFMDHRRWALRAFIAINGVWFFRVGAALWVLLNGGREVGFGENFDGPFVFLWHWGSLIVPLALLELYLWAKDNGTPRQRRASAAFMAISALGTGTGAALAFAFLWWPYM